MKFTLHQKKNEGHDSELVLGEEKAQNMTLFYRILNFILEQEGINKNLISVRDYNIGDVVKIKFHCETDEISDKTLAAIAKTVFEIYAITLSWNQSLDEIIGFSFQGKNKESLAEFKDHRFITYPIPIEITDKLTKIAKENSSTVEAVVIAAIAKNISTFSQSNTISFAILENQIIYPLCIKYNNYTNWGDFISLCSNQKLKLENFKKYLTEDKLKSYLELEEIPFEIVIKFSSNYLEKETFSIQIKEDANTKYFLNRLDILLERMMSSITLVKDISPITNDEKTKILVKYNNTTISYNHNTLYQSFEEISHQYGEKIALIYDNDEGIKKTLTYKELLGKVNSLATYIINQSYYQKGMIIAILLDPGFERTTSLLTSWKIGCTYMPIDPKMPKDRLKEQLLECKPTLLLTSTTLKQNIDFDDVAIEIIDLSNLATSFAEVIPAQNMNVSLSDPAYIVSTSGSTGKPKYVLIGQKQIANSILDLIQRLEINNHVVLLALANVTFDLHILEEIVPLIIGGTCVITDRRSAIYGPRILNLLNEYAVTLLEATPPIWKILLDIGWKSDRSLKKLCGGDVLTKELANQIAPVFHVYGTTETTTWSTCKYISNANEITIGRPIANTILYIFDQNFQLCPPGIIGRLFIGGDGLGCYLDTQLHSEKFINNPLEPTEIIYDTGDYCFWSLDYPGEICFVGRKDSLVKIQSQRTDINQIEEYLNNYADIEKCIVVPKKTKDQGSFLVAFIVPRKNKESFSEENFKKYCIKYLMPYMIPSKIILLHDLPLSQNAKIDRKSLENFKIEAPSILLRDNSITEKIINILAKILNINSDQIDIDKNFFTYYSTDSIAAARIITNLNSQLHINLPLKLIYDKPTVKQLVELCENKKSLTSNINEGFVPLPDLHPMSKVDKIPATLSQESIWLISNKSSDYKPIYINYLILELQGKLDLEALRKALYAIIHKHSILRTRFYLDNEYLLSQKIIPIVDINANEILKLQALPESATFDQEREFIANFIYEPLPLDNLPFKASLFSSHILLKNYFVFCANHMVFDGFSENIFYNELSIFYKRITKQKNFHPNELYIQYSDYAIWEQKMLYPNVFLERKIEYWKQKLQNYSPLALSIKKNYKSINTYEATEINFELSETLSNLYKEIAIDNNCSVFSSLLAVFKILLYRYSNQDNISIGIAVNNRYSSELEFLIGHFANILIIIDELSPEQNFADLMLAVHKTIQEALDNQQIPYPMIAKLLSTNKLTPPEIMFVQVKEPQVSLEGLEIRNLEIEERYAKYPLVVYVKDNISSISIKVVYSNECFEPHLIENFVLHFKSLITNLASNIHKKFYSIPMLTKNDIDFLKKNYTGKKINYQKTDFITCFEKIALSHLGNTAISYNNERVTYQLLIENANKIANYINNYNSKLNSFEPRRVIAIFMNKTPLWYYTIFGAMKSGASFLSIDVKNPPERIRFMLNDSKASLIITEKSLKNNLKEFLIEHDQELPILTEEDWQDNQKTYPIQNIGLMPDDLAYIIYTSGSTGLPKGAQITHNNLVNLVHVIKEQFPLSHTDICLAFSSLSFDACHFEWLLALVNGATLFLPTSTDILIGPTLSRELTNNNITVATLPPSILETIDDIPINVRILNTAGEPCSIDLVNKFAPNRTFNNLYGPSEATIYSVGALCIPGCKPVIGKPIPNTQVCILDKNLQLVSPGVPGNLFISGANIGKGYSDAAKNKTSFITINDPYENKYLEGYLTGDIVVLNSSGELVYLNRIDEQVKINGVRIELEEIAFHIRAKKEFVKDVAIGTTSNNAGNSKLQIIAYIVLIENAELDKQLAKEELKKELAKHLLPSMIPSKFIFIPNQLPLTLHGKIDFKSLKNLNNTADKDLLEQPQTKIEKDLAHIWAEVLQIKNANTIYRQSDFFESGGSSREVFLLIAKIKKKYEIKNLEYKTLFENSSLQAFASIVGQMQPTKYFIGTKVPTLLNKNTQKSANTVKKIGTKGSNPLLTKRQ